MVIDPEPSLKRVLKDAASRLNQLRMKVANLLDKQYYRDKTPDKKKQFFYFMSSSKDIENVQGQIAT